MERLKKQNNNRTFYHIYTVYIYITLKNIFKASRQIIYITQKKDAFKWHILEIYQYMLLQVKIHRVKYFLQNGSSLMNVHASSDSKSQNSLKAWLISY